MTTVDLSKLSVFEKANLRRLNKSIKPLLEKIEKEQNKIDKYNAKAQEQINLLKTELEMLQSLKNSITSKYTNAEAGPITYVESNNSETAFSNDAIMKSKEEIMADGINPFNNTISKPSEAGEINNITETPIDEVPFF